MKHLLTLLALLLRMCLTAVAQEEAPETTHEHPAPFHPYQEIMLGHGFMPLAPSGLSDLLPFKAIRTTTTGSISGTYRLHFTRLLSLGITAAYNETHYQGSQFTTIQFSQGTFPPTYHIMDRMHRITFTVASELTFTYLRSRNDLVKLYSGLGLGYAIVHERSSYPDVQGRVSIPATLSTHYTSNICLIGIRAGKALGGYAELGRGYKGTLCYGMYYSF